MSRLRDLGYSREEWYAGKPHIRICEGDAEWPSYSNTAQAWHKDALCKIAPLAKRSRFSPRSLAIHGLLADSSLVHCESRRASCRPHSAGTPLVHGQHITKQADT